MRFPEKVAWTGSSLDEMLADVVGMRSSLTDSELSDWFASDDSPGSALFHFMDSHHFGLLFQL